MKECEECGKPITAPRRRFTCSAECGKARHNAKIKIWIKANPESARASRKRWRSENPDKVRAQLRRHYYKNKLENCLAGDDKA